MRSPEAYETAGERRCPKSRQRAAGHGGHIAVLGDGTEKHGFPPSPLALRTTAASLQREVVSTTIYDDDRNPVAVSYNVDAT